jgi:hypothetical protein
MVTIVELRSGFLLYCVLLFDLSSVVILVFLDWQSIPAQWLQSIFFNDTYIELSSCIYIPIIGPKNI